MDFLIKTQRLTIKPYSDDFLDPYYTEFTDKITKYQYPDPFPDRDTAKTVMSKFVEDMERGEMLELVILSHDGTFLGSLEAFDLKEKTPTLGIWLKRSAQGNGYAYEALKGLVDRLKAGGLYECFIYDVDSRNAASVHLAEKFNCKKGGSEITTTSSGKVLHSQTYYIFD